MSIRRGGGAPSEGTTVAWCRYSAGSGTDATAGEVVNIDWVDGELEGSTPLLDLTDPTNPAPLTEGVYAFTIQTSWDSDPEADTLTDYWLDHHFQSHAVTLPSGNPSGIAATVWLDAGQAFALKGRNANAGAQTFYADMFVVKIA